MIRRRVQTPAVPDAMRRYLTSGVYMSGSADMESFVLAGQVLRARLDGLRAAWNQYGPSILADWPAGGPAPFAQHVLESVAEGDWRGALSLLEERGAPIIRAVHDDEAPGQRPTFKTNNEE